MRTALIITALLLAGCVTQQRLVKYGISDDELRLDQAHCAYEAEKYTVAERNVFMYNDNRRRLFAQCMAARGYWWES